MSVAKSLIKGAEEALAIAKGETVSAAMLKSAEPYEALVKGREGREVFTQKTLPDDVRAEMLAGIEQELKHD